MRQNNSKNRSRTRRKPKKKSLNPLVLLILIFILTLTVLLVGNSLFSSENVEDVGGDIDKESSLEQDIDISEDSSAVQATPMPTPEPTPFIAPWNLLLVNIDNALPENYTFTHATYGNVVVDDRMYVELSAMMNAASNAGLNLWIASGYRSVELQEQILTNATNNRMSDYGMTQEEARANALETIAVPGYSEHHTGLAVDFNYVTYDFEYTPEFTWLQENAENYGFILRFPADKVELTKINYEPWHYRYVGVEHAVAINDLGMCLEEYLEYLGA